jgi:hypothetical protein
MIVFFSPINILEKVNQVLLNFLFSYFLFFVLGIEIGLT